MVLFYITIMNLGTAFAVDRLRHMIGTKEEDPGFRRVFTFLSDLLGYSLAIFGSFAIVYRDVKIVLPMLIPIGAFTIFSLVLFVYSKGLSAEAPQGRMPDGFLYRDSEHEDVWTMFRTRTCESAEYRIDKENLHAFEWTKIDRITGTIEEPYASLIRMADDEYTLLFEKGDCDEICHVLFEGNAVPTDLIEVWNCNKLAMELHKMEPASEPISILQGDRVLFEIPPSDAPRYTVYGEVERRINR